MNNNAIVIRKKSRPYKYVGWDRITMIFKPNYNNIFHPTGKNIEKYGAILSQGYFKSNGKLDKCNYTKSSTTASVAIIVRRYVSSLCGIANKFEVDTLNIVK